LFLVGLQILPQKRCQCVLRVDFLGRLQDAAEFGPLTLGRDAQGRKVERRRIAEAHKEDSFAALGDPRLRADDAVLDVIAQLVGQYVDYSRKGTATVMALQVLDVFQNERGGPVKGNNLRSIEEQRALGIAEKSMRAAQGILLRYPGNGKGLARESGEQ